MIKYIRRTPKELVAFRAQVAYETSLGYPLHIAESRAWDCLFAVRRSRRKVTV